MHLLTRAAALFGFKMFPSDVTQAYLQSTGALRREGFVKACMEFELKAEKLLELLNILYGLSEIGDYWGRASRENALKEIAIETCPSDLALFYKKLGQELIRLGDSEVEDILHAGNGAYGDVCCNAEKKFNCESKEWDNTQVTGLQMETDDAGCAISQRGYIARLQRLKRFSNYTCLRYLPAQLIWTANSGTDVS